MGKYWCHKAIIQGKQGKYTKSLQGQWCTQSSKEMGQILWQIDMGKNWCHKAIIQGQKGEYT